ncbi:hypothetical protein [Lactiplantibacillus herbarum]|uniref:hypothetical protein n=1 Tax=Lactiplantibacillus herbarum TaxID=1670446 RepID=UPI00064E74C8|nr:hypothetical protein [Lactiplantibacillus herbarum]
MKVNRTVRAWGIILLATLIVVSPLLLNRTAILGVDGYFQYNRIYEAAMQLRHHNFSFLNLYSFQQTGRIVNQVYSPLLAYLFGGVLLLAGNWMRFQIVSCVLVMLVAGVTTYHAAQRLKLNFKISVSAGIIYMTSFSIVGFIYSTNWRSMAAALIPLLVGPMIDFYEGDWSLKSMLSLGVIVGLIAQVQILTVALSLPILIPFFVYGLIKSSYKWRSLGYLIVAIIVALLLSLNIVLPYLDINANSYMVPPVPLHLVAGVANVVVPFVGHGESLSVPVISIIFYLGLAGLLWFWKNISTFAKVLYISALVYIILGTNLIPWQVIENHFPILQYYLQLPFRFTISGMVFLTLGCLLVLTDIALRKTDSGISTKVIGFASAMMAVAAVMSLAISLTGKVQFDNNPKTTVANGLNTSPANVHPKTYQGKQLKSFTDLQPTFHTRHLGDLIRSVDRTTPDYIPVSNYSTKVSYYDLYNELIIKNKFNYQHTVKPNGILQVTWNNRTNQKKKEVPVFAYGSTKIRINGRKVATNSIKKTRLGTLIVPVKAGKNQIQLSYQPRLVTKLGIVISVIGWIVVLLITAYQGLRHMKRNLSINKNDFDTN